MNKFTDVNKSLWDNWAKINFKSAFYNVDKFKQGTTSLNKIELEELGNIKDKSILHLQCHFGLDTLSLAKCGAYVTGVDFSAEAIKLAQQLGKDLKIPAEFICSDIFDLPKVLNKQFDVVFTSYGVLIWLNNLEKWAEIIAQYLKPGGTFYIIEFHPFTHMFDADWQNLSEDYFYNGEPKLILEEGSYADISANFSHDSYEWPYTLSDVVNSLRKAGLIIDFLHEFPFSSYNCFPSLEESKPGEFTHRNSNTKIPLMFSIKATYMPELVLKTQD